MSRAVSCEICFKRAAVRDGVCVVCHGMADAIRVSRTVPHSLCIVQRAYDVRRGTLNAETGEMLMGDPEPTIGPCNVPLFSGDDRKHGVCRSCADGWNVPGNTVTDAGRALLAKTGHSVSITTDTKGARR